MSRISEASRIRARASEMAVHAPHFAARAATADPSIGRERIRARAAIGQAAGAPPSAASAPSAPMTLAEATSMLPGLEQALQTAQTALKSGAKCPDVKAQDIDTAKLFKDKMAQFVQAAVQGGTLTVEQPWLDAADRVVKCAIQVESAAPPIGAYVALGAVAMVAIVTLSI